MTRRKPTRKQVEEFIEDQLRGRYYEGANNYTEKDAHHYGRVELFALLNFIYGQKKDYDGPPWLADPHDWREGRKWMSEEEWDAEQERKHREYWKERTRIEEKRRVKEQETDIKLYLQCHPSQIDGVEIKKGDMFIVPDDPEKGPFKCHSLRVAMDGRPAMVLFFAASELKMIPAEECKPL